MDYNNDYQNQDRHYVILNGEAILPDGAPQNKPPKKKRPSAAFAVITLFAAIIIILLIAFLFLPPSDVQLGSAINKNQLGTSASPGDILDSPDSSRGTIPYSEMEYVRPDLGSLFDMIDSVEDKCETGTYDEVTSILEQIYSAYWHFDTMYSLADLKSCIDTTDEFYYGECQYFSENYPILGQKMDEMLYALAASPLSGQLDSDYYHPGFLTQYTGDSTYSDKLVSLYQTESDLVYQYQALISYPVITVNGTDVSLYDYLYETDYESEDYKLALQQYYDKYNNSAGEIYIELIKTRNDIAEYLGYDSYIDYAYANFSRDYTPEEVKYYIHTVCSEAVPLYNALYESGKMDDYYNWSYLSADANFKALKNACNNMGGDVQSIFSYMEKYGLYDITQSDLKLSNSFQTYMEDWSAPFIMLYPNLSTGDYPSFAHEFGHFIDAYINYNYNITTDASEACSMSMEYLAAIYSDSLSGDIFHWKMIDTVEMYAVQGAYNAFEEAVYSIPEAELTISRLNMLASDIFLEYSVTTDDFGDYGGKSWIDIPHFFSNPFYIVSYIISNDAAYQICSLELNSPGKGVDTFIALADRNWDLTYLENLDSIGLDASLSTDSARRIISDLYSYFDK